MAVGRQRAGRPIAGLTCNMRERRNSTGSGATGRRRSACPVATGPFPQSTTRRVRARAFVRVLGQAARAAAAHVLTAASFVPSPAPAEQTLSGRDGFILTFVDLLSVFITRRFADTRVGHATDFHSAHLSPRGAGGKPVPTRTASKIIGQLVSPPIPCGSSSGPQRSRRSCRSGWDHLSAHLAPASSLSALLILIIASFSPRSSRRCPGSEPRKVMRPLHEGARGISRTLPEEDESRSPPGASGRKSRCCSPISSPCGPTACVYPAPTWKAVRDARSAATARAAALSRAAQGNGRSGQWPGRPCARPCFLHDAL